MTTIDNIVESLGLKQLVIDHGKPCGDCQECCTTFQIQALGKPSLSRCQHQCSDGCAIYESKPVECSNYFCEWKYGELATHPLPESCRPDRCGIILSPEPTPTGLMLCVYESRPGALASMPQELREHINRSAIDTLVWIVPFGAMGSKRKTKLWKNVYQLEPPEEQAGGDED